MNSQTLDKAQEDIKTKQAELIKSAVKATLESIDTLEKIKIQVQDKIKILKHDLFDLKDGRLDRILERQTVTNNARGISVMLIDCKDNQQKNPNPWYVEYKLCLVCKDGLTEPVNVNNSIAKMHASGSYKLADGSVKFL